MSEQFSLEQHYDAYERLEEDFQAALDISLNPGGPSASTSPLRGSTRSSGIYSSPMRNWRRPLNGSQSSAGLCVSS